MPDRALQSPSSANDAIQRVDRDAYEAPAFLVPELDLEIALASPITRVAARFRFSREGVNQCPLRLDGIDLNLVSLELDGQPLGPNAYAVDRCGLTIFDPPDRGEVRSVVEIDASRRRSEGLFILGDSFVTNCEPDGFRRITWFPDRPDVLTRMRVTLSADRTKYPTLLSNGRLEAKGELGGGRHFACWRDPFPKAAYLFALVAGDFAELRESHVTASGKRVELCVHAARDDIEYCEDGLSALKRAIAWDEAIYGLEYDLDELNVVVLRSYPGGAMECKGLNLFSTEFFLASAEVSTDEEMRRIEAVVGHEYFHNWTGNRVGCRDWFELSLKEGLTVLREQQFIEARVGKGEARIDQVVRLRETQFDEDDGKLAHSVRPASYATINNLYTRTIYEKGAEILRMLATIVGEQMLIDAIRAFLRRFDGCPATIDDLLDVVEEESGIELAQFRLWYDTPGRPRVEVATDYDAATRSYRMTLHQSMPRFPAAPPLHIPVRLGLLDGAAAAGEMLVHLRAPSLELSWRDVEKAPIPALFRGFSAPVDCKSDLDTGAFRQLAIEEGDAFIRWNAARELARRAVLSNAADDRHAWLDMVESILGRSDMDAAFRGRLLLLPTEAELGRGLQTVDVELIETGRRALARAAARTFADRLRSVYQAQANPAREAEGFGARRLRKACLAFLIEEGQTQDVETCWRQWKTGRSMEERANALRFLIQSDEKTRNRAIQVAYRAWRGIPLALDQWFAAQAAAPGEVAGSLVRGLLSHRDFSLDNSRRVKAVLDTFCVNLSAFHQDSGAGYHLIGEIVLRLDTINPRLSARFFRSLGQSPRFDAKRRRSMKDAIAHIASASDISDELRELVHSTI